MKKNIGNTVLGLMIASIIVLVLSNTFLVKDYPVAARYTHQETNQSTQSAQDDEQFSIENQSISPGEMTDHQSSQTVFPLELNSAKYDELVLIPKIGDVTAQRILQYKEKIGAYTELGQLIQIKGISQTTLEIISKYLYIA